MLAPEQEQSLERRQAPFFSPVLNCWVGREWAKTGELRAKIAEKGGRKVSGGDEFPSKGGPLNF